MTYMKKDDEKYEVWPQLIECKDNLLDTLKKNLTQYEEVGMDRFNQDGWTNLTFRNSSIRRAHIDVVDARETKGLWMMHVCCFPQLSNPGPIYGFDIIAGKYKVTGAFHDFSPLLQKEHPLTKWFIENTKWYTPSKERELPDWAKAIFSGGMVAAGNVTIEEELHDICKMAENNLFEYISRISEYHNTADENEVTKAQNYYCEHQNKNPHTPRVMKSLGLNEADIKAFCKDNLFPKIR
jgi:phycocyanobilin:ferredoxin oxidoreductase